MVPNFPAAQSSANALSCALHVAELLCLNSQQPSLAQHMVTVMLRAAPSYTHGLQVRDMLVPLVQPWIPLVCTVLASDPSARASWPTKLAALRLGQALANYFSKPLAAAMPQLMGAAWQLLLALQVGVGAVTCHEAHAGMAARPAECGFHCAQRVGQSVPRIVPECFVDRCLLCCCRPAMFTAPAPMPAG